MTKPNLDMFEDTPTPPPIDIVTGTLTAQSWQTLHALVTEEIEQLGVKPSMFSRKELRKLQAVLRDVLVANGVMP